MNADPNALDRAPQELGGWLLVELLGRGGMGEVWLAERAGPGGVLRRAALKRILGRYRRDGVLLQRFMAEARTSARLEHANIVRVLDFGEHPEPYLVLEYVEGISVGDLLQEASRARVPVPAVVAAFVCAEAAAGLDYAHRKRDESGRPLQIVHRDVSPQNVLLSVDGAVKVGDFGVARAADNTLRTAAGVQIGKLVYMSPEQANGRPLDGRADVFSLGIVLWEMLTLRPLFARDDAADALARINAGDIPPPSSVQPHLPAILDEITMTALAVDPDRRFATAAAFAQALRKFIHSVAPGFDSGELIRILHKLLPSVTWHVPTPRPRNAPSPLDPIVPASLDAAPTVAARPGATASPFPGSLPPTSPPPAPSPAPSPAPPFAPSPLGFAGSPPASGAPAFGPAPSSSSGARRAAVFALVLLSIALVVLAAVFGVSRFGSQRARQGANAEAPSDDDADGVAPPAPTPVNLNTIPPNIPLAPALSPPRPATVAADAATSVTAGTAAGVAAIQRALSRHEREFGRCFTEPQGPRARITLRVAYDAGLARASQVDVTSATRPIAPSDRQCVVALATRLIAPPKVNESASARWSFWIGSARLGDDPPSEDGTTF